MPEGSDLKLSFKDAIARLYKNEHECICPFLKSWLCLDKMISLIKTTIQIYMIFYEYFDFVIIFSMWYFHVIDSVIYYFIRTAKFIRRVLVDQFDMLCGRGSHRSCNIRYNYVLVVLICKLKFLLTETVKKYLRI